MESLGFLPLSVIEVQNGKYLGEDDIVRFDDAYGRIPEGDTVFVCDDCLLAIVADDDRRDTAESLQCIVVCLDSLHFFRGGHSFRIDILGIREDSHNNNNRRDFACEAVDQFEGFPGKATSMV